MPGGGVVFIRAINAVNDARAKARGDEKHGFDIVAAALATPLYQIASNAGVDGDVVVETVRGQNGANGYNAATDKYVDLVKEGIIDPAKVAKTALINAGSVAGLMLTTDVLATELKEDEEAVQGAMA